MDGRKERVGSVLSFVGDLSELSLFFFLFFFFVIVQVFLRTYRLVVACLLL